MALCSIAIAAGIVGVVVAMKAFVFRRRFGRGGCGYAAFGPGAHDGWDGPSGSRGRWRRGPGGSFWLRGLFRRLDTTPGQEREIRSAIEELQTTAYDARHGLFAAREDVARAISGESFDDVAIAEAGTRVDDASTRVKEAFASALKRIHTTLDAAQRQRLAEILTKGPGRWRGGWGGGGPYRGAEL